MEVILFPDVSALYADYLTDELADRGHTWPVGTTIPNPRPATFVRLLRTGGIRRNIVVDETQLTVETWAEREEEAHDMSQLVRGIIYATRGLVIAGETIYNIGDITGPGSLPSGLVFRQDALSAQARFSFTLLIAVRGTVE
jgi:hypothetical protein